MHEDKDRQKQQSNNHLLYRMTKDGTTAPSMRFDTAI